VTQSKRSTVFDRGGGKDLAFTAIDNANLDTDEAVVLAMSQQ
jgi:hypothetical protein